MFRVKHFKKKFIAHYQQPIFSCVKMPYIIPGDGWIEFVFISPPSLSSSCIFLDEKKLVFNRTRKQTKDGADNKVVSLLPVKKGQALNVIRCQKVDVLISFIPEMYNL